MSSFGYFPPYRIDLPPEFYGKLVKERVLPFVSVHSEVFITAVNLAPGRLDTGMCVFVMCFCRTHGIYYNIFISIIQQIAASSQLIYNFIFCHSEEAVFYCFRCSLGLRTTKGHAPKKQPSFRDTPTRIIISQIIYVCK